MKGPNRSHKNPFGPLCSFRPLCPCCIFLFTSSPTAPSARPTSPVRLCRRDDPTRSTASSRRDSTRATYRLSERPGDSKPAAAPDSTNSGRSTRIDKLPSAYWATDLVSTSSCRPGSAWDGENPGGSRGDRVCRIARGPFVGLRCTCASHLYPCG